MSFESNSLDNNEFDKEVNAEVTNPYDDIRKRTNEKLNDLKERLPDSFQPFNSKKFEELSKSPEVKRSLEKILLGCANESVKKDRELLQKEDISSIYKNIIKDYPALRVDLSVKFWLNLGEKKFSNLPIEKKNILIGLYRTYKEKPKNQKVFLDKVNLIINDINESTQKKFNWKQFKNAFIISKENPGAFKKTLIDLWVQEKDIPKFKEYLDMLKKYPKAVQEAWFWNWFVIGLIIWVLLTWAWVYIYNDLTKPDPSTEIFQTEWKIENIREVLKVLMVQADFEKTDSIKKKQFTLDEDGNPILNYMKERINKMQSIELKMQVKGNLGLKYDFTNVDSDIKYKQLPNWTELVKADIYIPNPPEVVIMNSKSTVLYKNRERIQLESFNQVEQELKDKTEKAMIEQAMEPWGFYDTEYPGSLKRLEDILQSLLGVWKNRTTQITIHVWDKSYSNTSNITDAPKTTNFLR